MSKPRLQPVEPVGAALRRLTSKPVGPAFSNTDAEGLRLVNIWVTNLLHTVDSVLTVLKANDPNQPVIERLERLTHAKESLSKRRKKRQTSKDLEGDPLS